MRRHGSTAFAKGIRMPTLLELQRGLARSLLFEEDGAVAPQVVADGLAAERRLAIYRHTAIDKLTTALRFAYPAVDLLVGADFFAAAAARFIEKEPPLYADLATYGAGFPAFLAAFPPAERLPYLAGVARLDQAVARARHAPDATPLDPARLGAIAEEDASDIAFRAHPAVGLVADDHPVDAIWRAVLDRDDAAMAAIDPSSGPVRLLVERTEAGVLVTRLGEIEWRFAKALFGSRPLAAVLEEIAEANAAPLLAEHLMAGRLIGFACAKASRPAVQPTGLFQ